MLKTCYKKANSIDTFYQLVKEGGLETYERSGKITGVIFNGYKFRFSRLGFTDERINELKRQVNRKHDLETVRSKKPDRIIIER